MSSPESNLSSEERALLLRKGYVRNGGYAFLIMAIFVLIGYLFPPFAMLRSYLILAAHLVAGTAAGYYFSQDLDSKDISFQTKQGVTLWLICSVAFIGGILLAGTSSLLVKGTALETALTRVAKSLFDPDSLMTTAASLVLGLLGIALGRDIYLEQFTMLSPLSKAKAKEVREITHSVQPLIEARHKYGRSFTKNQLSEFFAEEPEVSMDEVLSDLMDQGVLRVSGGSITITSKGSKLLSVSRFVEGIEDASGEGGICAYCGRPIRLSDKVMRIEYYGKPYLMHYSEREGVRIFGRLPYIDRVLGLKPAQVSKPVYREAEVLPTIDHKVVVALGLLGAGLALGSYTWLMINADLLPVATEVSFFGGTLLSVSLIFACCGLLGAFLSYFKPGKSYGGGVMIGLFLFALPFIVMTRQIVFGGYYVSVVLIAIGGVISLKSQTRIRDQLE